MIIPNESEFSSLLHSYLLPMFPGARLEEAESADKHGNRKILSCSNNCRLLISPSLNSDFRVPFIRSQEFDTQEKHLVEAFAHELEAILKIDNDSYLHELMAAIPRRIIAKWLCNNNNTLKKTILEVMSTFETLAAQTYEGKSILVGVGITGTSSQPDQGVRISELFSEDFSRVLSNGFDSIFLCSKNGKVFNLEYLNLKVDDLLAPIRMNSIAKWCSKPTEVAVVLNRSGEVLIFKDKSLKFSHRRGKWRYYPHASIIKRLAKGNESLKEEIYKSCLDTSFARTGGCICLLSAEGVKAMAKAIASQKTHIKFIQDRDIIDKKSTVKSRLLSHTLNNKVFHKLDRRMRLELLGMDGAIIIEPSGKIVSVGAIVSVPGGSSGGGRKAAAIELSKYGIAIKISSDGPIEGYRNSQCIFTLY